jgi:DNA adenine methylase
MKTIIEKEKIFNAKPFLKWAGGKTQLLDELIKRLPTTVKNTHTIDSYVEPFVGGGAMFFYLKSKYDIKKSFLFDINRELIVGYKVIQNNHKQLINRLEEIEKEYLDKTDEERKEYYYKIRYTYNKQMLDFDYENYNNEWIERASYLIFLNKTCYNGLFRQNKKGEFNVPHGSHKNPSICCRENIIEVNKALKDTEIFCADFVESKKYINKGTFVYLDPPYLPISKTASFTKYSKEDFNEKDQVRLAQFFVEMNKKGAFLMLSNSDPKNEDPSNDFFDKLYKKYYIDRVNASRIINCIGSKRGLIKELIITNYKIGE